MSLVTRAYNSFDINKKRGTIIKKSKDEKLHDEISYYKSIRTNNNLYVYFPRYISDNYLDKTYYLELEYYAYDNLGDHMISDTFDENLWYDAYTILKKALIEFSAISTYNNYKNIAKSMYVDKTEKYFKDLTENFNEFNKICLYDKLTINSIKYMNFQYIWEDIKKIIENDLYKLDKLQIIHGDFCFSNILCGINKKTDTRLLKFVDPRGSFGKLGICGDPLYDYAKLYHSFNGCYEYIIYDKFNLKMNDDLFKFDYEYTNDNYKKIEEIFSQDKVFTDYRVKLISGLIFIGMCSRHYDSFQRQIIMYCTGVRMLNEVLENYVKR